MFEGLYGLVMMTLQPLLRRSLKKRASQEPLYMDAIEERFGKYQSIPNNFKDVIWIHSVSLGETHAVTPFVVELRKLMPDLKLLLTHMTATGREAGRELLQEGDYQVWLPWDTPRAVRKFLTQFRPKIGLLMETEVWPILTQQCARAKVPLCIINARLSEKSFSKAKKLSFMAKRAYTDLTAVWAQSQTDADRLMRLGAKVVGVYGNFKFDVIPSPSLLEKGKRFRTLLSRPTILLASAREGEDAQFFQEILRWRHQYPNVLWMIVPRNPQRFESVKKSCQQTGLSVLVRSKWNETSTCHADVFLGDSMAEMPIYYAMADVALLGGSFEPFGGQNLIEAAACDCPVIMGEYTFNFAQACEISIAAGSAVRVHDMMTAVELALEWLKDNDQLQVRRNAASHISAINQGASFRTALDVFNLITTKKVIRDSLRAD